MNIEHLADKERFRTVIDGKEAHVSYRIEKGGLDIRHTIVPVELEGRGIASALVKAAYDYARENNLKPVATCSYAVMWLQRHPEYDGTPSEDFKGRNSCAL